MQLADIRDWRPRFRISYGALLAILVTILLVMPPMVAAGYGLLIVSTLFPALFVIGLFSVIDHPLLRLAALPLALMVIVSDVFVLAFGFDVPLVVRFIDIFFMIIVAIAILIEVMRADEVTTDADPSQHNDDSFSNI